MKRLALVLPLALIAFAPAAFAVEPPPVVTRSSPIRIWVDQIGYRTQGAKMAVIASDAELPDDLQIELRDEQTNRPVWKLSDHAQDLTKFANGRKDGESGDYIDHLDFSGFTTPGRYYFVLGDDMRSYKFNIAENPYYLPGLASWKAYYYGRADGEILEKYGGEWHHGKAFLGPGQATEAQVYKWKGGRWPDQVGTEIIDPKKYDVHGGWFDAGDLNKYTSNTTNVHNMLLMAYEMVLAKGSGPLPKDSELNIPESGNGVPDVLDEIRVATEFLIRDHDGTGAAFGRVHQEFGSPPDSVKTIDQLTMPNSEVTMGRASALAYAAVVWRESKLDSAFAAKCYEESLRSWNLLQQKPAPWPVDPKDPRKVLSQGEMRGDNDYATWRTVAAAALFRYTGEKQFDTIVHESLARRDLAKDANDPALWIYIHAKGADPALVSTIKKAILGSADSTLKDLNGRGYHIFMPGYWWGSNQTVGDYGGRLTLGALITDDKEKKKAYLDGAENYVHYLYGRNPRGECYFTNMKAFGAEKSAMVMFHGWVGNVSSRDPKAKTYIGEGPGKIGPFPGYVIGGPNGNPKRLVEDENLDWTKNPWEFNEPDITYQSQCLRVLGAFIWPQ